ncbi:TPA_asm: UL6.7 sORF 1 [Human alphaherpesvirus 1]|nr:TPA_asm: UL6.7 sORF 1 [Human alphaherpesvirus 1]
MIPAGL